MGSRFPPEVFGVVIEAFTTWSSLNPKHGVRMSKREVGACSLTSRFWAQRCRYWQFASISFHSREDFDSFLNLVDTAPYIEDIPSLVDCVQEIDIIHSGPWALPWFHHVLKDLKERDIDLDPERISLEIKEAFVLESQEPNVSKYAPRSLSTSLPRSMPRSLYSHAVLHLTDLRFRSIRDLLRLIDDQADLMLIDWKRLSFDEGVTVPPARSKRRRPWFGMEEVASSEWSNVEMELRIMFLIAWEKIPANLLLPMDAWTLMPQTAQALLIPSTSSVRLCLRGESKSLSAHGMVILLILSVTALGITFQTKEPNSIDTHLLEFHILSPDTNRRPRTLAPKISLIQVWIRARAPIDELKNLDWAAFEEATLSFDPAPLVEFNVENTEGEEDRAKDIFRWLLDVVPKRSIMAQTQTVGRLALRFAIFGSRKEFRKFHYITSQEILSAQSEYILDNKKVVLTPPDVFGLMVCDENKKEEFFRNIGNTSDATPAEARVDSS